MQSNREYNGPIIVAEDDTYQREALVFKLEDRGYRNVAAFMSVDEALKHMGWTEAAPRLTQNIPVAIITDNNTGSAHGGLDLLRATKGTDIVRILMSGDPPAPAAIIAAGGPQARVITKPYDTDKLIDTLEAALGPALNPGTPPR